MQFGCLTSDGKSFNVFSLFFENIEELVITLVLFIQNGDSQLGRMNNIDVFADPLDE